MKKKSLRDELDKVKPFIEKFTFSSQKLNMILNNQQIVFDKAGLGFRSHYKQKCANNLFRKLSKENRTCHCCGKLGHKSYTCNFRKNSKTKKIWIVKGSFLTNHEGLKKAWIPENT